LSESSAFEPIPTLNGPLSTPMKLRALAGDGASIKLAAPASRPPTTNARVIPFDLILIANLLSLTQQ